MSMQIVLTLMLLACTSVAAQGEQEATCSLGSSCPAASEGIPDEGSVLLQGMGARKKAMAAAEDDAAKDSKDNLDATVKKGLKELGERASVLASQLETNENSEPEAKEKIAKLGEKIRALHEQQA